MQGAEIEDEGSVLKYMTKSEIEEQRSSLLIMTQRFARITTHNKEEAFLRNYFRFCTHIAKLLRTFALLFQFKNIAAHHGENR